MNENRFALLGIALAVAVAGAGFTGCSHEARVSANPPEIVHDVALGVAKQTPTSDWLEAVGTVRAAQTSELASQVMGNIREIQVREGDRVQSGQVLAVIDEAQSRATEEQAAAALSAAQKEVAATETQLALATATQKRYQQLYDRKSVSAQEYDEIKARYQVAEARRDGARASEAQATAALAKARTSLGYTRVRAPFAGVITEKRADAGTLAAPGILLFVIEDQRRFRLEVNVDESGIRLVQAGKTVPVGLDALAGTDFSGTVARVVPAADPASRSFVVKIDLPVDTRIRSGLFGRARLLRGTRNAMLIPQSALVERGQLRGIFVVSDDGIAQLRYVAIGRTVGGNIEVLSGLQDGEKFAIAPGARELSGKQIATQR